MNPTILIIGCCLFIIPVFGQALDTFKRFSAPGISGVYRTPWDPFLPTDKGNIFSVGFYLSGNEPSTPIVMWIPHSGDRTPIEIKSLAGINIVAREIAESHPEARVMWATIESARRFIANTIVAKGRGGFSLDPEASNNPKWVFSYLSKAGMGESDLVMLKSLLEQASVKIGEKEWTKCWFEVDSLGSVERITIAGTVSPPAVKSLKVESVFDAGRIDVEILRKARLLQMAASTGP